MDYKIRIFKSEYDDVRKVVEEIILRDISKINGKRVLEIGCGSWDYAKKVIEKENVWIGLEPVDLSKNNLTFIKGSVGSLPFHDKSFDIVICNQTIEHWFEYGVSFGRALGEIHRVLKVNGTVMINAPINIHGHPYFLRGDLPRIKRLFKNSEWDVRLFERCIPKVPHKGWKKVAASGFFNRFGYPDFLVKNHASAYSYILNIHAVKKGSVSNKAKIDWLRPIKVILRFIKELVCYYC